MNRDEQLKRLLNAAKRSQREPDTTPSFTLEARVLGQWRTTAAEDQFAIAGRVFRWAAICAGVLMILSIGWSQIAAADDVPGVAALANLESALRVVP